MEASEVPKKRRISIRKLIFIVVVCGLVYWLVLAAPISQLIRLNQLVEAKTEWEASGIQHYRIVFDLVIPLQLLRTRFVMTVKNGQIEEVLSKGMVSLIDRNYNPDEVPFKPVDEGGIILNRLSERTVKGMFQNALSDIIHSDVVSLWYDVEFDPQYHYVSLVQEHCYGAIGDCGFYYRVIEFEPLTDG